RHHRIRHLVGVLAGPALALLGHAEMHVGVDEAGQQPSSRGVVDLRVRGDLQLGAESGDAAVLHEDGAVEGFALDRDDMGMGDGGDRHAMTFRRGRGGVKSGAHGVRRRRPGPGADYSASMSKQTTTEKQTAATTEKAEAPQTAAAATTKADKAKKAEKPKKPKKAEKAEKAENPEKPKKAEKPKKTETPKKAEKAAKRAKRPAVTAPADPRPVGFRLESGW